MSNVKSKRLGFVSDLFFLLPPAADTWPDVLLRTRRQLLLLHRWAGTCPSVTPGGTLQLLVLGTKNSKCVQHSLVGCPPVSPSPPGPARRADGQVRIETRCSAGSCAVREASGEGTPPAPKVWVCSGEVLNNRASQSLARFEQGKINNRGEGLPEDSSESSSYGNDRWCQHRWFCASYLTRGKLVLDCHHSILLDAALVLLEDESELCFQSPEKSNQSYLDRREVKIKGNEKAK